MVKDKWEVISAIDPVSKSQSTSDGIKIMILAIAIIIVALIVFIFGMLFANSEANTVKAESKDIEITTTQTIDATITTSI